MRKLLVFSVFFVLTTTAWASDNNHLKDSESILNSGMNSSVCKILEDLDATERENAIIEIECRAEAEAQANLVEEEWNSGNYNAAIELLKDSPELENAAIGIQWKEPIGTTSLRWGNDVRIGERDSIEIVSLDVDNSTGHLFTTLKYITGSNSDWAVYMSTDTGKSWVETYTWGSTTSDIDGVVHAGYYYVGYSLMDDGTGRIRRFSTSTGELDGTYSWLTVIDEGVYVRDIALTSTIDNSDPPEPNEDYLLYFAIMDNDSLRLYWSDTLGTSWVGTFDPDVGNADRGLDACCAVTNPNNNYMWASYIGIDDSIYAISGWSAWNNHGALDYVGTGTNARTSIGAFQDTTIITFPHYNPDSLNYEMKYRISYDNGDSWLYWILASSSSESFYMNDVTARNGGGFGVVYQNTGGDAEAFFTHRGYSQSLWSTPVSFADSVPRASVKPSIERIASGLYGIAYVNFPQEIALFEISDPIDGIKENDIVTTSGGKIECSLDCSVILGTTTLKYTLLKKTTVDISLVNILGQKVASLDSGEKENGEHTVSVSAENLSQGIYYIVIETENGQKGIVKAAVLK